MSIITLEPPVEIKDVEPEETLTPEQEAEWRWYYYLNETTAREETDEA